MKTKHHEMRIGRYWKKETKKKFINENCKNKHLKLSEWI